MRDVRAGRARGWKALLAGVQVMALALHHGSFAAPDISFTDVTVEAGFTHVTFRGPFQSQDRGGRSLQVMQGRRSLDGRRRKARGRYPFF